MGEIQKQSIKLKQESLQDDLSTIQRDLGVKKTVDFLTRSIEEENRDKINTTDLAAAAVGGVAQTLAIYDREVDTRIAQEKFIARKNEIDNTFLGWSSLELKEASEHLNKSGDLLKQHLSGIESDLKDMPGYLRQKATDNIKAYFGKSYFNAKKAMFKRSAKASKAERKLIYDTIVAQAATTPEKALEFIKDALPLMPGGTLEGNKEMLARAGQEGVLQNLIDNNNFTALNEAGADKTLSPELKKEAAQGAKEVNKRLPGLMDNLISNGKTIKDHEKLEKLSANSSNSHYQAVPILVKDAIFNSFVSGSRVIDKGDEANLRRALAKVGTSEEDQSKFINNLSHLRQTQGAEIWEVAYQKDYYTSLSLRSRSRLGLPAIKHTDKIFAGNKIIQDPTKANSIARALAEKAGVDNIPKAKRMIFDSVYANLPKGDNVSRDIIDILRADGFTQMDIPLNLEQLVHTARNHKIPVSRAGSNDQFLASTGHFGQSARRTAEIAVYTGMVTEGKEVTTDADFKDEFKKRVETMTKPEGGFWDFLNFGGLAKPDMISHQEWDSMAKDNQRDLIRVIADFGNDSGWTVDNLDGLSWAAVQSDGADVIPRLVDGRIGAYVRTADGQSIPLTSRHGDHISVSIEDAEYGINISPDGRTQYTHNWGLAEDSVLKLQQLFGRKHISGSFVVDSNMRVQTQEAARELIKIPRKNGEVDEISLNAAANEALLRAGLPEHLAPILAMQMMKESGRWGRAGSKADIKGIKEGRMVKLASGKEVKVIGWAQVTEDKAISFAKQGIDVTTKHGSMLAMAHHMRELLAQGYKLNPKASNRALLTYALKNYNGGVFIQLRRLEERRTEKDQQSG